MGERITNWKKLHSQLLGAVTLTRNPFQKTENLTSETFSLSYHMLPESTILSVKVIVNSFISNKIFSATTQTDFILEPYADFFTVTEHTNLPIFEKILTIARELAYSNIIKDNLSASFYGNLNEPFLNSSDVSNDLIERKLFLENFNPLKEYKPEELEITTDLVS